MDYIRVIPCLDIKDGRLVKGINFIDIKDLGDPVEAAYAYSQAGADELTFLDISATLEGRGLLLDTVARILDRISIPLIVGGGIASMGDIERILDAGVAKLSIASAAIKDPGLIREAAKKFGSQPIIVAIDAKSRPDGGYNVYTRAGTTDTGIDVVDWAKELEQLGAGEILLTSMDTDGTKMGFDIRLTRQVTEAVTIPVIASGGAGRLEHFAEAVTEGGASAVLAASLFHYGELSIVEVKKYLREKSIAVRMDESHG
ncbi:MAG: imidazole glycerol phosphate synthase subunit HisF [Eubacteriales bacterium]|jgi:cyclase|nr:imidazole glycerol phosphate synthase subunit HisF [Bacillota bacterium]